VALTADGKTVNEWYDAKGTMIKDTADKKDEKPAAK